MPEPKSNQTTCPRNCDDGWIYDPEWREHHQCPNPFHRVTRDTKPDDVPGTPTVKEPETHDFDDEANCINEGCFFNGNMSDVWPPCPVSQAARDINDEKMKQNQPLSSDLDTILDLLGVVEGHRLPDTAAELRAQLKYPIQNLLDQRYQQGYEVGERHQREYDRIKSEEKQ